MKLNRTREEWALARLSELSLSLPPQEALEDLATLFALLEAERARVVELEAFRNGYKHYIRKLQDSAEAERALSDRLAGALRVFARTKALDPNGVIIGLERYDFECARSTLAAHTAAREEPHDKG